MYVQKIHHTEIGHFRLGVALFFNFGHFVCMKIFFNLFASLWWVFFKKKSFSVCRSHSAHFALLYAWIKNARSMFVAKFCVSVEIFCVLVAKYCVFGAKYCVCVQVYNSLLAFFLQRVFFLNLCLFVHLWLLFSEIICKTYSFFISARPYESCKIFKGRPRRNAFSKLVHRQYKSFPPDRFCQVEIQNTTGLSNKPSTA